jgi:hypothetical protein
VSPFWTVSKYHQGRPKTVEVGFDCQGLQDFQGRKGHPDQGTSGKPAPQLFFDQFHTKEGWKFLECTDEEL